MLAVPQRVPFEYSYLASSAVLVTVLRPSADPSHSVRLGTCVVNWRCVSILQVRVNLKVSWRF